MGAKTLTIDDLLILEIDGADARDWLSHWTHRISGQAALICMSKFGDLFLRRTDGSTDKFSVLQRGELTRVAATPQEFLGLMASEEWRATHLFVDIVAKLHEQGQVPDETQCYGFAPHPVISGKISADHAIIMDIGAWHFACARLFTAMETGRRN